MGGDWGIWKEVPEACIKAAISALTWRNCEKLLV
jgi:hypothetical protein